MCDAQMPASISTNDIMQQLDISLDSVHSRVYKQLYYEKVRARWGPKTSRTYHTARGIGISRHASDLLTPIKDRISAMHRYGRRGTR